ncbi:MAG: glycosyltransferase [Caulobacteraceae bacterium]
MMRNASNKPLRVVIATAHAHIPQLAGGAQSSTHDLVTIFESLGHQVCVLAALNTEKSWLSIRSRVVQKLGYQYSVDKGLGYDCYRSSWPPRAVADLVKNWQPDAFIVQSMDAIELGMAINAANIPLIYYFRNALSDGANPEVLRAAFVSNSEFTARYYRSNYGISSTVIPPLVRRENYDYGGPPGGTVLFINPVEIKGRDIALGLATRCPDIPFTFIDGWGLSTEERALLLSALSRLPNVTYLPATRDMKTVYAKARIVLAPSKWEEAWGRIATEAQINAIPVLGSDIGGLPEAIGPGGKVVDPNAPLEVWESALRSIWSDEIEYSRLSSQAKQFSNRTMIKPEGQAHALLEIVREEIERVRTWYA